MLDFKSFGHMSHYEFYLIEMQLFKDYSVYNATLIGSLY